MMKCKKYINRMDTSYYLAENYKIPVVESEVLLKPLDQTKETTNFVRSIYHTWIRFYTQVRFLYVSVERGGMEWIM